MVYIMRKKVREGRGRETEFTLFANFLCFLFI